MRWSVRRRGEGAQGGERRRGAKAKVALAEVIPFHLEGLRATGALVPRAESVVEWVEVQGTLQHTLSYLQIREPGFSEKVTS